MSTAPPHPSVLPTGVDLAAVRAAVARVAEGHAARERAGTRRFDEIALLRDAGAGAVRVPAELGGAGLDLRGFFDLLIDLGRADPDVAQSLRAHFGFGEIVRLLPDPELRGRWFGGFTEGRIVGNAVTEPAGAHAGDFVGLGTTVTPDGDDWVIDGTKYYTTGTLYADDVWVWGVTPDGVPASAVVPTTRDGVTVTDDWDGFGQRATASGTATFTGVRALAGEVFGGDPDADPGPRLTTGAFLQLYLTAIVAGITQAVLDDAVALLRGRSRSFTHGTADLPREDPNLQQVVGEISAAAHATRSAVLGAADALDRAGDELAAGVFDTGAAETASVRAAQAKLVVDRLALDAATALFDAGGASATRAPANLDRHWRSVRTLASHNPGPLKARVLGAHLVNGDALPDNTYF